MESRNWKRTILLMALLVNAASVVHGGPLPQAAPAQMESTTYVPPVTGTTPTTTESTTTTTQSTTPYVPPTTPTTTESTTTTTESTTTPTTTESTTTTTESTTTTTESTTTTTEFTTTPTTTESTTTTTESTTTPTTTESTTTTTESTTTPTTTESTTTPTTTESTTTTTQSTTTYVPPTTPSTTRSTTTTTTQATTTPYVSPVPGPREARDGSGTITVYTSTTPPGTTTPIYSNTTYVPPISSSTVYIAPVKTQKKAARNSEFEDGDDDSDGNPYAGYTDPEDLETGTVNPDQEPYDPSEGTNQEDSEQAGYSQPDKYGPGGEFPDAEESQDQYKGEPYAPPSAPYPADTEDTELAVTDPEIPDIQEVDANADNYKEEMTTAEYPGRKEYSGTPPDEIPYEPVEENPYPDKVQGSYEVDRPSYPVTTAKTTPAPHRIRPYIKPSSLSSANALFRQTLEDYQEEFLNAGQRLVREYSGTTKGTVATFHFLTTNIAAKVGEQEVINNIQHWQGADEKEEDRKKNYHCFDLAYKSFKNLKIVVEEKISQPLYKMNPDVQTALVYPFKILANLERLVKDVELLFAELKSSRVVSYRKQPQKRRPYSPPSQ